MVTLTCPWCDEEEALSFPALEEPETSFTCPDCGTSVRIVDVPVAELDLAT